jgi:hypothetical protein
MHGLDHGRFAFVIIQWSPGGDSRSAKPKDVPRASWICKAQSATAAPGERGAQRYATSNQGAVTGFPIFKPVKIPLGFPTRNRWVCWQRSSEPNKARDRYVAIVGGAAMNQMNQPNPNIVFEAKRLARAPGWYVRVAWPDGRHDHVPGFVSEDEALRWIEHKAEGWLSERGTDPVLFAPFAVPERRSRSAARARVANGASEGFRLPPSPEPYRPG